MGALTNQFILSKSFPEPFSINKKVFCQRFRDNIQKISSENINKIIQTFKINNPGFNIEIF